MIFSWLEDAAKHRGMVHAVVQRDTYLSFRGLLHRANRRMSELASLGVEPGDAVGIMLGNVSDYLVLAAAVDQLGAIIVPIGPLGSGRELDRLLELVPLRALITRPGAKVLDHDPKTSGRDPGGPVATQRSRLQGSLLSCALFPRVHRAPPGVSVVFVISTPGGGYRAVYRTAENLIAEAENLALALSVSESDRISAALPFHHPFGFTLNLAMTLGYGAQLHLDDDLAARRTMQRVREASLSIVPVCRSLVRGFVGLPTARPLPSGDVRFLCVDGPVGRSLSQAFFKTYKARIEGMYHRAETGLVSLDRGGRAATTVGTPVKGLESRVVDPHDEEVAVGHRGRLLVRGKAVSAPPSTGAGQAWIDTDERALQDKQGRLKLVARTDDLCSVEGHLVSLEEVRQALLAHPAVVEATVSMGPGVTNVIPDTYTVLHAEVRVQRKVSPERLSGHCAQKLSLHKIPEEIVVS